MIIMYMYVENQQNCTVDPQLSKTLWSQPIAQVFG